MINSFIMYSFLKMSNTIIPFANYLILHPVGKPKISLCKSRECEVGNWLNSVEGLRKQRGTLR